MPLFEYECNACGRRFERIQKFSDPLVDKCPACGEAARRLVSSPAIQFKGSGFYITDYAKKSGEKPGEKSGEKTGGDDKAAKPADSKGTEAKPSTSSDAPKSDGEKAKPETKS